MSAARWTHGDGASSGSRRAVARGRVAARAALLWSLLVAALLLHVVAARVSPFTNDEGAYLYDARMLTEGVMAGGDGLVKSPVALGAFALSVLVSGGSLFAARAVSVIATGGLVVSLYALGRRLVGPRAAWVAVFLFLFTASAILLGSLGTTEPLALALGVGALALVARGRPAWWSDALAGVLFGLGFGARKTTLLLVPAVLVLLWVRRSARVRRAVAALAGFSAVLIVLVVGVLAVDERAHVADVLGAGQAAVIRTARDDPELFHVWVRGSRKMTGMAAAFRLSLPLVAAAGLAALAGTRGARSLRTERAAPADGSLGFTVLAAWVGTVIVGYLVWPVFLVEYALELLPPVALVGGWGVARLRGVFGASAAVLLLAVAVVSGFSAVTRPPVGSFTRQAVEDAADVLEREVPLPEPVFTGAVIVPYLSGHRVLFDIAHPMWYRFPFVPDRERGRFLPPLAVIDDAVRTRVGWALVDQLTDFAYLRHQGNLLGFIWEEFSFVQEIPNDTGFRKNPLYLWERPRETEQRP